MQDGTYCCRCGVKAIQEAHPTLQVGKPLILSSEVGLKMKYSRSQFEAHVALERAQKSTLKVFGQGPLNCIFVQIVIYCGDGLSAEELRHSAQSKFAISIPRPFTVPLAIPSDPPFVRIFSKHNIIT